MSVGCIAGRLSCVATTLTLTHSIVRIAQLSAPRLYSQRSVQRASYNLAGVNGTVDQVILGATLSDGTQLPALFQSDGTSLLAGLVSFNSGLTSAVEVSMNGRVTLRGNHHALVPVTVAIQGDATVTPVILSLACNLDPSVGDVDLGAAVGIPLGPMTVGQTVNVPVRVNSGVRLVRIFPFNASTTC